MIDDESLYKECATCKVSQNENNDNKKKLANHTARWIWLCYAQKCVVNLFQTNKKQINMK